MHLRLIWKGNLIRENALLVFEKSIDPSAQRHLPATRLLQRVYAPTRPQQRVYATTRLRHNASTPTRPHQHVYANASEPQRVSANASAANASSAAPTRLPQRVPTHASESQRACSNASPPARWLPRVARRAFSQVSAPTRLLWPVRMSNFFRKLGFRSRPLQKSRKNVKRNRCFCKK